MELSKVMTELTKEKLSLFRRYFFELVVIGLVIAVVFQNRQYNSLNNYVRDRVTDEMINNQKVIVQNTATIQEFLLTIKSLSK